MDGKNIRTIAPTKYGQKKGYINVPFLALVDAHSRFLFIDVGCNGEGNDNTIFKDGVLYKLLTNNELDIPRDKILKGQSVPMPYFFVGNDAFQLGRNVMIPFNSNLNLTPPEDVLNYRVFRARMTVKCAFSILANRFQIFQHPMGVPPDTVDKIIMAACALHNYLTPNRTKVQNIKETIPAMPCSFAPIGSQLMESCDKDTTIRDNLANYCVTEGNVPFQWANILR